MRLIVCGAGKVGYGIASHLSSDHHVTVVDASHGLISRVTDSLDVRGETGYASHPDVLERAGAADADMLVAVTQIDEVNVMSCQIAHSLFDTPIRIARIRAHQYLDPRWGHMFSRDNIPIDSVISPEREAADAILQQLELPGVFEATYFVDGRLRQMGIHCDESCPILDMSISDLRSAFPKLTMNVAGIVRGDEIFAPDDSARILAGDRVYVVALSGHAGRALDVFGLDRSRGKRVVIAGGGNIGRQVAERLESSGGGVHATLIEEDHERSVRLADNLSGSSVLHGNALDQEILEESEIESCDSFLALTNDDRVNLLSAAMAKEAGARRTMSLVSGGDYLPLLERLGIDSYVDPQLATISSILRHIRRGRIHRAFPTRDGRAEFIEAEALETSPIVGRELGGIEELGRGLRIAAISRDGRILVPSSSDSVRPHDRVVAFVLNKRLEDAEQLFRVGSQYF